MQRSDFGKWATAGGQRLFGSLEQASGRAREAGKSHRAAPSEDTAKAYKAAREHVRRVKELANKAEQSKQPWNEKNRAARSTEERAELLKPLKEAHAAAKTAHGESPTPETAHALEQAQQKLRAARSEAGSATPAIKPEQLQKASARLKAAQEDFQTNFYELEDRGAAMKIHDELMRATGEYETDRRSFFKERVRVGDTETARSTVHADLDHALAHLGPKAAEEHGRLVDEEGDEDEKGNIIPPTPAGRYRAAKTARAYLTEELHDEHLTESFKEDARELHAALNPAFDKPAIRAGVKAEVALAKAKILARLDELIPLPTKPAPRARKSK